MLCMGIIMKGRLIQYIATNIFIPWKCANPNKSNGSSLEPTATSIAAAAFSDSVSEINKTCKSFGRVINENSR